MTTKKIKPYRTHDEATAEMFRRDPELAAEYLNRVLTDGDETDIVPEKNRRAAWGSSDSVRRLALRPQAEAQHRWQPVYRGTEARRSGSEGVRFLGISPVTHYHYP